MPSSEIFCGAGSRALQNILQALQEALYVPVFPGKNLRLTYISESRAQTQTFQEQTLGVELGHKSLAEMSPNQVIQRKVKYTWKAAIFANQSNSQFCFQFFLGSASSLWAVDFSVYVPGTCFTLIYQNTVKPKKATFFIPKIS